MSILHPNHVTAFALAAVVARRLPSLLAAIEAGRRTRTSLRSFPSSSCSRRTPTLSHRYHLSLEESPCRREPQPPSAETFASLGEHPHDPPSIMLFFHRVWCTRAPWLPCSGELPAWLWRRRVSTVVSPPSPAGAAVSRPRLDRRPRFEREIPLHVFDLSRRSKKRWLSFNESQWTRGLAIVDPVYGPWTYFIGFSIEK
jgi:hypothetical protein